MRFVKQASAQQGDGLLCSPALTTRERQVAQAIAFGHTSKQIAQALGLSDLTVRKHRENLYRKLDVHSIAELTRLCLAYRLVEPATP